MLLDDHVQILSEVSKHGTIFSGLSNCQTCRKKSLMIVKSSFPKGVLRQQYCAQWSVAEIQWLRQRPGTSLCQCFYSPVRTVEDNIELKKP